MEKKPIKLLPGTIFKVVGYDARLLLLAFTLMPGIASCGICKPKTVIEYRDSVRVEYRDRIIHDTATFEIPVIVEKNVTKDTVSHLENPYAKSDAVVSEGLLWHTLETKPQTIAKPIKVRVTDTLYVEKASETIVKEVEVEKPLTWWQQFRLEAFWWLVLVLVLTNIKSILKLIKVL